MRLRAVILGVIVAAVTAAPAMAKNTDQLPDLPGLGVAGRSSTTTSGDARTRTGTGRGSLPAARPAGTRSVPDAKPQARPEASANPAVATPLPFLDQPEADAAPDTSKPASDSLPSTGVAAGGLALLGIALVAGGKLLSELVRPFSG